MRFRAIVIAYFFQADVRAQLTALVAVTTAGACNKHEPEGYGSRDDNEPVLHGF